MGHYLSYVHPVPESAQGPKEGDDSASPGDLATATLPCILRIHHVDVD